MLWPLLCVVTFFAAAVQSALGFGFGLIAVAGFLILFNSVQAIQIVIIITVVMSLAHYPNLRANSNKTLLIPLVLNSLIGFPIGIGIYLALDLSVLTLIVANLIIVLSIQSFTVFYRNKKSSTTGKKNRSSPITTSVIGIVAGALAMPGPIIMLYLNAQRLDKDQIRALMSGFFIFAYLGALIFQAVLVGVSLETWIYSAWLLPFALIGTYVGHLDSKRIPQHFFHQWVLLILLLSGVFMLLNI